MPWPQKGATQYHAQLGFPDKGHAIKGLGFCNNWDLEPLDLINGQALDCPRTAPLRYKSYIFFMVLSVR